MNQWNINRTSRNFIIHTFKSIVSLENLFSCWREFRKGKKNKLDVFIEAIVGSFVVDNFPERERELKDKVIKRGLPIGNVTSQIFANIYLNELDRFIKYQLHVKYYFRYADDFVIISDGPNYLYHLLDLIEEFLTTELLLNLHADKVNIRKFRQGIDFLGYVILPYHSILRNKTKRRMLKKLVIQFDRLEFREITVEKFNQIVQSYLGILKHCRGYDLSKRIKNVYNLDSNIISSLK